MILTTPAPDIRCLTLTQPWAWLVATGRKNIENRPRGFSHKSYRGPFYIHAATESEKSVAAFAAARGVCAGFGIQIPHPRELKFGGVVGVATIVGIIPPGDSGVPWHFPDQYGFRLADARELAFVPCRGFQGFWRPTEDVRVNLQGVST